ncbi:hypothetical protein LINPERPRIM_LOCUS35334 [Linum perenne]
MRSGLLYRAQAGGIDDRKESTARRNLLTPVEWFSGGFALHFLSGLEPNSKRNEIEATFHDERRNSLEKANELCLEVGRDFIGVEHLMGIDGMIVDLVDEITMAVEEMI